MRDSSDVFSEVDRQLRRRRPQPPIVYLFWAMLAIITPLMVWQLFSVTNTPTYITAQVTQAPMLDSVRHRWVVFTPNEVLEDSDNWFRGKINSADVANSLKVGQTYCLTVGGTRVRLLGRYRNILRVMPGPCGR